MNEGSEVFRFEFSDGWSICRSADRLPAPVRITGQISGSVADPFGAVVRSATLTISQASTGFSESVTANESGEYVFPAVQPGVYQLKV